VAAGHIGLISTSAEIEEQAAPRGQRRRVLRARLLGLFAAVWRSDARGAILGLTSSQPRPLARAVLEATAFQSREVIDAMKCRLRRALTSRSRRRMVVNELLMQFQADIPRSSDPPGGRRDHVARLRGRSRCRLLEERRRHPQQLGARQAWTRPWTNPAATGVQELKKAVTKTFDWSIAIERIVDGVAVAPQPTTFQESSLRRAGMLVRHPN